MVRESRRRKRQTSTINDTSLNDINIRNCSECNNHLPNSILFSDVKEILKYSVEVKGARFDRKTMAYPEYAIYTEITFTSIIYQYYPLISSWKIWRPLYEFQILDQQLRKLYPFMMENIRFPKSTRRNCFLRLFITEKRIKKNATNLNNYLKNIQNNRNLNLTFNSKFSSLLCFQYFLNFEKSFGKNILHELVHPEIKTYNNDLNHTYIVQKDFISNSQHQLLKKTDKYILRFDFKNIFKTNKKRIEYLQTDEHVVPYKRRQSCVLSTSEECIKGLKQSLQQMKKRPISMPLDGLSLFHSIVWTLENKYKILKNEKKLIQCHLGHGKYGFRNISFAKHLRDETINYGLLHAPNISQVLNIPLIKLQKIYHKLRINGYTNVNIHNNHKEKSDELITNFYEELLLLTVATLLNAEITILLKKKDGGIVRKKIMPMKKKDLPSIRHNEKPLIIDLVCFDTSNSFFYRHYLCLYNHMERNKNDIIHKSISFTQENKTKLFDLKMIQIKNLAFLDHSFTDSDKHLLFRAILNVIWKNCNHNPVTFQIFQKKLNYFIKLTLPVHTFYTDLITEYGIYVTEYIIDLLLHIIPNKELKIKLAQIRWNNVNK